MDSARMASIKKKKDGVMGMDSDTDKVEPLFLAGG
jgi:hypothetical protein